MCKLNTKINSITKTIWESNNQFDWVFPEIIDDAKEIFNLESSSDADKSEAEKNVEELLKTFTIQDSIESIVKAKGFSECLCYISDQGVSVIVPKSQLDDTSVLIIDDAVVTHYEVDYDDISVIGA